MHRTSIVSFLVLCLVPACINPKSSLGDLPGTTEEGTSSTSAQTGELPTDDGASDIGAPCQTNFLPQSHLLETDNAACLSNMCLYADSTEAPFELSCAEDADCGGGAGQGVVCGPEGECILDPGHIAARSMCTDFCEQDADCVGADGTQCQGGFTCVPIQALGEAYCQRVCACLDDVDLLGVETLAEACENGTQPGCCDQDPPGEACGGG